MKKLIAVLITCFTVLPLFAFQDGKAKLEIAYETEGYIYREPHMDLPIKVNGVKQGASIAYTQYGILPENNGMEDTSFGTIELRYMTGSVDYSGFLWDGTTSTGDDMHDYYYEGRLLAGQRFTYGETFALSPYIGVGYRYLCNHAEKMSGGYQRESTYLYIPIGTGLSFDFADGWQASFVGEFDWLLKGSQYSKMSDSGHFDPPYDAYYYKDTTNAQENGFGLRASLKLEKDFGAVGLFAEPFYRFWKIQNSQVEPLLYTDGTTDYYTGRGLVEPFNITREYGVKVGLSF